MELMKKSLALLLALVLVLSFVACATDSDVDNKDEDNKSEVADVSKKDDSASNDASSNADPAQEDGVDFDTIPIKLIAPITGDSAQYGEIFKAALQIAVDERNEAGGIHGAMITVDVYDDKNDPKETVSIANKILSENDTFAVVGPYTSTCALAAGPLFQEAGVIVLEPSSSHADFTAIGEYMFRGVLTQEIQSAQYAKYLKDVGGTKLGILYLQDDTGVASSERITKAFTADGGEVLVSESYLLGTTKDFSPMLTKMKAAGCDCIYVYGPYNATAVIVNQMATLEYDVPVVGQGNIVTQEFFEIAGENAEGVMTMAIFQADYTGEKFVAFKEKYEALTGNTVNTHAVALYDLVSMLFDAIEEEKTLDASVLKDWIRSQTAYEGLCGPFAMDGGDPQKSMFRMIAKDGQFVIDND